MLAEREHLPASIFYFLGDSAWVRGFSRMSSGTLARIDAALARLWALVARFDTTLARLSAVPEQVPY